MTIFLVDYFKECCNDRLKKILTSCYLSIKEQHSQLDSNQDLIFTVCEIYVPQARIYQLKTYENTLITIGDSLDIDLVEIIPLSPTILTELKEDFLKTNNLATYRTYLDLQYLY